MSRTVRASEVFIPGALPTHTYYDRQNLNLEWRLLEAVETKGFISSVSGPSKSGKTVLCERVIGQRRMLLVTGGGVSSEAVLWRKIRTALGLPLAATFTDASETASTLEARAEMGLEVPFVADGRASLAAGRGATQTTTTAQDYDGPDGTELLKYIGTKGLTLVVDDFHYINRDVQRSLAEQFKEAARQGTCIVVVTVSHRCDDAIRANPDLRGRVVSIDIPYWEPHELRTIAEKGFPLLNVQPDSSLIDRFVAESVSSPQLMQAICLQFCREMRIDEPRGVPLPVSMNQEQVGVLLRNATAVANCRTAFDILLTGPKPRGTERKTYQLQDGKSGDVYYVILRALGSGQPLLSLPYATLKDRIEILVPHDPPRGVGVIQALQQMHRAVLERLGEDRVLDWDEEKEFLSVPDPYFLYFIRWSDL